MSAIAVKRCTLHSCSPLRALPKCLTRRSTVSSRNAVEFAKEGAFAIESLLSQKHIEPGEHGQHRRRGEDRVAAAIGVLELEAVAGVPGEMADAAAQVIEERNRPARQKQHPDRRSDGSIG